MRYFTKEWYELTNKTAYTAMLDIIEADGVSFKDIYIFKLDKELKRAKRKHNQKPKRAKLDAQLADDIFNLNDWAVFSDEVNDYVTPKDKQQVIDSIDREYQRALVEFNNREEFDEEEFIDAFNETYHFSLKMVHKMYPSWLLKEVDKRLLALDLIPQDAYNRLLKEEKENERIVRKTHKKAIAVLNRHAAKLTQEIASGFNLEDASVISFRQKKNKDVVMKVVMGPEMDETYRKFTFKEADIIEYDDTLKFGFNYYPHGKFTRCNYLFTEIYKYKNYMEVHMMLENSDGCKYITLRCKDIIIEDQQ